MEPTIRPDARRLIERHGADGALQATLGTLRECGTRPFHVLAVSPQLLNIVCKDDADTVWAVGWYLSEAPEAAVKRLEHNRRTGENRGVRVKQDGG